MVGVMSALVSRCLGSKADAFLVKPADVEKGGDNDDDGDGERAGKSYSLIKRYFYIMVKGGAVQP